MITDLWSHEPTLDCTSSFARKGGSTRGTLTLAYELLEMRGCWLVSQCSNAKTTESQVSQLDSTPTCNFEACPFLSDLPERPKSHTPLNWQQESLTVTRHPYPQCCPSLCLNVTSFQLRWVLRCTKTSSAARPAGHGSTLVCGASTSGASTPPMQRTCTLVFQNMAGKCGGGLNRAGVANAGLRVGKSPAAGGGAERAAQRKDLVTLQCLAGPGLGRRCINWITTAARAFESVCIY